MRKIDMDLVMEIMDYFNELIEEGEIDEMVFDDNIYILEDFLGKICKKEVDFMKKNDQYIFKVEEMKKNW